MNKYTINNTIIVLLALAILCIWIWIFGIPTDPLAIWRIPLVFLILITIDRYKEVKNERQLR